MSRANGLRLSTAMLLSMAPVPVLAQAAGQGDDGEIVVTAQKREERLIDVPQSITAVSGDDLARLNATQLRDYAAMVPALTVTTSGGVGQGQISLRGVTSGTDVGPTVGIYVDDVPYGSSSAFASGAQLGLDAGLFDLDRVEVLRGPQGTLYGASAMGGVLKYVTRRPSLDGFEGMAQAGLSFTRHGGTSYNGAAAMNAPVVKDRFGIRASGYFSRDGGYVENVALGENNVGRSRVYGARLDLLLKPTDNLSVRLVGFAQNIHQNGTLLADYNLLGRPVDGDLEQRRLKPEGFDQRFRMVSGTIDYDFGGATLTAISSYQTSRIGITTDVSALYVPILGSLGLNFGATIGDAGRSTDKFAQEVRIASSGGGRIEWLVGGFYTHEKSGNYQHIAAYDLAGAPSPIDLATAHLPSRYEEIAGFGNVTVHLSDRFDVTGGLRYSHNDQRFTQNATGLLIGSNPAATSSENVVTYLANARYRFSGNATAYARFATGYRPGGPNFAGRDPLTGALLAATTFRSDTLKSYEAGFKGETSDRRFGIDVAAYHIDWNDMQVATAANGISVIANADSARIDGAELTLTARPSRTITVTGAFAYQHARLAADAPALGGVKGERLPNVPRVTAAINADYRARGEGIRPTFGATLRFVSDRRAGFDASTLPQYDLGDYATIDLRAGATFGPIDAQLFVRNLFDSRGQLSAVTNYALAGGPAQVAILQPRTIGLNLTSRF